MQKELNNNLTIWKKVIFYIKFIIIMNKKISNLLNIFIYI